MSGLALKYSKKAFTAMKKDVHSHSAKLKRAGSRALNKTAVSGRKITVDEVRKEINIKAGAARKQVSLRRSRPSTLKSVLLVKHKPIPLAAYAGVRQTKKGVSVQMMKSKPRKLFKGAFIATMPSGHRGVYRRKGKGRLPIQELYGPNVQSVFVEKVLLIQDKTLPVLEKNLDHEIRYELSK